jgi:hypothetical protein
MKSNHKFNALDGSLKCGAALLAVLQVFAAVSQPAYGAPASDATPKTTTPIKNVIIIIGENRTFDHVYGTYVPKSGQTVWNLLSEGIVTKDGKPGENFSRSAQYAGSDTSTTKVPIGGANEVAFTPTAHAPRHSTKPFLLHSQAALPQPEASTASLFSLRQPAKLPIQISLPPTTNI